MHFLVLRLLLLWRYEIEVASESDQKVHHAHSLVVAAETRYTDGPVSGTQHSTFLNNGMVLDQSEAGKKLEDTLAQLIFVTVDGDGVQEMKVTVNAGG